MLVLLPPPQLTAPIAAPITMVPSKVTPRNLRAGTPHIQNDASKTASSEAATSGRSRLFGPPCGGRTGPSIVVAAVLLTTSERVPVCTGGFEVWLSAMTLFCVPLSSNSQVGRSTMVNPEVVGATLQVSVTLPVKTVELAVMGVFADKPGEAIVSSVPAVGSGASEKADEFTVIVADARIVDAP